MPFIDSVKRINVDEFKPEDRDTVEKLAEIYNYFAEQVTTVINGNIDYDNLKRSLIDVSLTLDSSGIPTQKTQFMSDIGLLGTKVIKAENLTNSAIYPTSAPFIIFTTNGQGLYTIQKVLGVPSGSKFKLTVELVF